MEVGPGSELRRRLAVAGLVTLLGVTLGLSYVGKAVCVDGQEGFWAFAGWCYSDVWELWDRRGFDTDTFPYHGPPGEEPPDHPADRPPPGVVEYPPGMALPAWGVSLLTTTRRGYFALTGATLAIGAVVTLWQLDVALRALGRPRVRLLGFVLSPTLVALGMQNWDLWVLPLVAAGLAAAARRRPVGAGVWFGLGAAVKWWPVLLVPLVLVGPWRSTSPGWRRLAPALVAAGAWAMVQAPAVVSAPRAWWAAISFHLTRPPNPDSTAAAIAAAGRRLVPSSFWGGSYTTLLSVVTAALLAGGVVLLVQRVAQRRLAPPAAALALVTLFLVTGKVFSPQFVLWLLPLAAVSRVPWTPVLGVEAINVFVWFAIAMGYTTRQPGLLEASQVGSVVRTGALVWLLVAAVRAGQPPATAGTIETTSPSLTVVSNPSWKRTSSSRT